MSNRGAAPAPEPDVIVGAGIVGLNCAFWPSRRGRRVTVVDRDPAGDKASVGNAGAIAVTDVTPTSAPGLLWRIPGWLLGPLCRFPCARRMRCA